MKQFLGACAATALIAGPAPVLAKSAGSKKPATATAAKQASKPRTALSMECSKEADAKGLHGKERKAFRDKCKHNGK